MDIEDTVDSATPRKRRGKYYYIVYCAEKCTNYSYCTHIIETL